MEKSDTIVIAIRVSKDTPLLSTLSRIAETAHRLHCLKAKVIICTTGVANIGMSDHRRSKQPPAAISTDASAAVGQGKLTAMWDQMFSLLRQSTAHISITQDDIKSTRRMKKIQQVVNDLLVHGTIPIVSAFGRVLPGTSQCAEACYLGGLVGSITGSAYIVVAREKHSDLHQTTLRSCLDLALMVTTAMDIGTGNFAAVHLACTSPGIKELVDYGSKSIIEDIDLFDRLPATIQKLQARRVRY